MVPVAQVQHDGFLPPLNQCFAGDRHLISWANVHEALSDATLLLSSLALPDFLLDPECIISLSRELDPRPADGNAASRSNLDARLAVLGPSASQDKHDDATRIKDDTLWLAQAAKVDEITALRIVVLEVQHRAQHRLLNHYTEEEDISVQQALHAGANGLSQRPQLVNGAKSSNLVSNVQRHERLLLLLIDERQATLAVAVYTSAFAAYGHTSTKTNSLPSWFSSLAEALDAAKVEQEKTIKARGDRSEYVSRCINAIQSCLIGFEDGCDWSLEDEYRDVVDAAFRTSQLYNIVNLQRLLLIHTAASDEPDTPAAVQGWFSHVDEYAFFMQLRPISPFQQTAVDTIQILASIISLSILKFQYSLDYLKSGTISQSAPLPPVLDLSCQKQINDTLLRVAEFVIALASPALLGWSIILQTVTAQTPIAQGDVMSDDEASLIDDGSPTSTRHQIAKTTTVPREFTIAARNILNIQTEEDPILYLAKAAIDGCRALPMITQLSQILDSVLNVGPDCSLLLHGRLQLFNLVRQSVQLVEYSSDLLEAVQSLHKFRADNTISEEDASTCAIAMINHFLSDHELMMPGVLLQAQSRYPYELLPFLQLCKSLTPAEDVFGKTQQPANALSFMSKFTQIMPHDFTAYELVREDENANCIRLTENLPLFVSRRSAYAAAQESNAIAVLDDAIGLHIPRGSIGLVMSESRPFVVMWNYPHEGVRYLAVLLSTSLRNSKRIDAATRRPPDRIVMAEIIGLLAVSISPPQGRKHDPISDARIKHAHHVLGEASDGLDRNEDIVSIVAEIFEEELSRQSQRQGDDSTALLVSCTEFLQAALVAVPGRVWPIVSRIGLIDTTGSSGKLAATIASLELPNGRFDLLVSSLDLFEALVADTLARAVQRKGSPSSTRGRFAEPVLASAGLTDKLQGKIFESFVRLLLDILQSSGSWKFVDAAQERSIQMSIIWSFTRILNVVFGFGDGIDLAQRITSTLSASATLILDAFVTSSASGEVLKAVFRIVAQQTDSSPKAVALKSATVDLLTTLVRISNEHDSTVKSSYDPVLKAMPLFARLYASHYGLRYDIIKMLTELVACLRRIGDEIPSLLGCLSMSSALDFLNVVGNISMPLLDSALECRVWDFLTAALRGKQQWLGTFVLTGRNPRRALQTEDDNTSPAKVQTLLRKALKTVSTISTLHDPISISLLQFIATAQDNWPWTTRTIVQETKAIGTMIAYVEALDVLKMPETTEAEVKVRQIQATALIAETLAMMLHNSCVIGDESSIKLISVKLMAYYRERAVAITSYSSSLHDHLQNNFEQKFPSCPLNSFKRVFPKSEFGTDHFYDLEMGNTMLSFDPSWRGSRGNGGFRDEFIRVNRNLSVVEAEISRFNAWKFLATELSAQFGKDNSPHLQMAAVVNRCLRANIESTLPEDVFGHLLLSRTELALVMMQRLVAAKVETKSIRAVLPDVWETVRNCGQNFDLAFVGPSTVYYRSLLKIMLLAIQPHIYMKAPDAKTRTGPSSTLSLRGNVVEIATIIVEIVTEVIAKGFYSLATTLHETPSDVLPADLALITALFRSVLRIDGIATLQPQLALRLQEANVGRHAAALFSWSDQFTADDNDPVFGELSIAFLVDMSSMLTMADSLAVDGLLANLSTASISHAFSEGRGVGPLEHPQRLHVIWARGLLVVCLNLLVAVGETFAAEAAAFLNSFPAQLHRASGYLDMKRARNAQEASAGRLTLNTAMELHTLALLSMILDRYRSAPTATAMGQIEELTWDAAAVKADLEGWLNGRKGGLLSQITATTEQEVQMTRQPPTSKGDDGVAANRLEEMVLAELEGALICLGGTSM